MERSSEKFHDLPPIHQYPDPEDYAPNADVYSWDGEDYGYVPPTLPSRSWNGADHGDWPASGNRDIDGSVDELYRPVRDVTVDSDYEISDVDTAEDENFSDGDSGDDFADSTPGLANRQPIFATRTSRQRGSRGRPRGVGRGGRGGKRGIRKALEPTLEFKQLHSNATIAFIDHNYEEAEELTMQALQINPEMYSAYNLLSEIHAARGDTEKAISAAWNGAHTQPRDPEMWSRLARMILEREGESQDSTLQEAIYCYSRIINLDSTDVEARYQRAALNHELGHKGKAAKEYEQLLKQLPHDTTVLRHLAKEYIELGKSDRPLNFYKHSISFYQSTEPDEAISFTWSDVNIVAELYGFQKQYEEGLSELKSLARWLLGRRMDLFWENHKRDDREWDVDDQPRRAVVSEYVPSQHDATSYGLGLPLELRIKMGVFRLRSEHFDLDEAINHFEWLDPEDHQTGAKLFDFPDLFREAGNALRLRKHYHEALRYYEPLQKVSDYEDISYLLEMANCYRAVGLGSEAEHCYSTVIDLDHGNPEASLQLARMGRGQDMQLDSPLNVDEAITVNQYKARRPTGSKEARRSKKGTVSSWSDIPMIPGPVRHSIKKQKERAKEEDVRILFQRRQDLMEQARLGDEHLKDQYMSTLKSLSEIFGDSKIFYPYDKFHRFYGYSREARLLSMKPKHEIDRLIVRSKWLYETDDGEMIIVPNEYCGITFDIWLDVFLEYALDIAKCGNIRLSYEVIASAFHANVFYHSIDSLCLIHVCWFSCALIGNDDETLCNIARWFMKEYQFVTDTYCLFSALNRLCDSENSWYNCGPSQKYVLRQIKAVDFSLVGAGRRKPLWQEKAPYTTKDSNGTQLQPENMDVALLMLYGHILYAGKSYSYAINYFLRALALDPTNSTIKLSLALAYLHYALKRQAENRHHILMQGFAFLSEYYDSRQQSKSYSERQEAEFNVGHAYHILGLTHLAIPFYERCLDLSSAVQTQKMDLAGEDFAQEAAFALQGFWAASGNLGKAKEVTERFLVV